MKTTKEDVMRVVKGWAITLPSGTFMCAEKTKEQAGKTRDWFFSFGHNCHIIPCTITYTLPKKNGV